MEIKHILAILVVLMLSGCATEVQEQQGETVTPDVTPQPAEQPPAAPVEEEKPVGGAADVQVLKMGFDPEELTVSAGTVVTWKNMGGVHIVSITGVDKSQRLVEGNTFEYKFDEAGTYEVTDVIMHFRGTVIVK